MLRSLPTRSRNSNWTAWLSVCFRSAPAVYVGAGAGVEPSHLSPGNERPVEKASLWESIFICSAAVRLEVALDRAFLTVFLRNKPRHKAQYHIEERLPVLAVSSMTPPALISRSSSRRRRVLLFSPWTSADIGADTNRSRQNGTMMGILLAISCIPAIADSFSSGQLCHHGFVLEIAGGWGTGNKKPCCPDAGEAAGSPSGGAGLHLPGGAGLVHGSSHTPESFWWLIEPNLCCQRERERTADVWTSSDILADDQWVAVKPFVAARHCARCRRDGRSYTDTVNPERMVYLGRPAAICSLGALHAQSGPWERKGSCGGVGGRSDCSAG